MSVRRRTSGVDIQIGKNLRCLRNAAGISQEELSAELDISYQQLQKYEQGKNRISSSTLYRLSQILNVAILEFFRGLKDTPEEKHGAPLSSDTQEILNLYQQLNSAGKKNIKAVLQIISKN